MAQVTLTKVVKRYPVGDVLAVDNLDLQIADGEFLVLLGPSGCGKTTTLRMIAGLEDITAGDIHIGDRRVNDLPPGDRDIAFVFQFYALYPHLNVRDNITFPLRAQQTPKAEVERRLQQVAKQLRIEHILNKRPGRLPGGEQQRVALGRAIIRRPQVFLMDEPLTNLDAALRADMRVELKHLQQELGTTMVYVTHDQTEALSMSHRIAVMNLGVLQQVATPLDIYNYPATLFVATFIGSPPMNTLPCRVQHNMLIGTNTAFQLPLTALPDDLAAQTPQHDLVFGVRSENIHLQPGENAGDLHGVILVREPLGDETLYQVQVDDYFLIVKTLPQQLFYPGDAVSLTFDRDRIHLFAAESGRALRIPQGVGAHV